jgi:hypothetical protein
MTQTEWIISLDDDLKDHDELFVGTVRDGDRITRCRDCIHYLIGTPTYKPYCRIHNKTGVQDYEFCSWGERKEE